MAGKAGRSGRTKTPALIRELEGNRGHRPIPQREARAKGSPIMPDYLNDEQRKLWAAVLALAPQGLLAACDSAAVEVFVNSWWTFRSARREINRLGLMVRGSEGNPMRNPLLGIARGAAADMHAFGADLGLSPVARTRLIEADAGDRDPLAILMGLDEDGYGPDSMN